MKKIVVSALAIIALSSSVINAKPELIFPYDNETLTDLFCSFKAKITEDGPYKLELSRDKSFSTKITRDAHESNGNKIKDDRSIVYFLTSQGTLKSGDRWVLDKGDWYWRITANNGNSVSDIRKLTVTTGITPKPVDREISSRKPLFHMRFRRGTNDPLKDVARIIPEELKEYMVLDLGFQFNFLHKDELDLYKYAKKFNDTGYKFAIDFGYPNEIDMRVSLGEIEQIYRDLPNFVGGEMTEMFYRYRSSDIDNSHVHGAMMMSRKYGKYMFFADMNWKYNKYTPFSYELYDEMRDKYADYFIPGLKMTDPFGAYTAMSAMQGMKLSGMVNNFGIWSDMWTWEKFGEVNTFGIDEFLSGTHGTGQESLYPYIQHMKQYIYGITTGATVFGLEPARQWSWGGIVPNDLYNRYLMPFIKAVVNENMIPSTEAINNNFKVVVDTEVKTDDWGKTTPVNYMYGNIWGDYLRNTFGIADIDGYDKEFESMGMTVQRSAYIEMLPNTDRYPSGIPFLAKSGEAAPTVNGKALDVVKISDMTNKANVEKQINRYYPETGNEAFAVKIDSSLFVFNTNENHDIKQNYSVDVNYAGVKTMKGGVDLMTYIMGRMRPDGKTLFFQANAYKRSDVVNNDYDCGRYRLPTYPTKISFECTTKPIVQSKKIDVITEKWDASSKTLTLTIDHSDAGAVDFTLGSDSVAIELDQKFPGIIEAEDYDKGGEGVAYHDIDSDNESGAYRTDGVDIENCSDDKGTYNVSYTDDGEWLNYTLEVKTAGTYDITLRVASVSDDGAVSMNIGDQEICANIDIPNTFGWGKYVDIQLTDSIHLDKGIQTVVLDIVKGGFNINYFEAILVNSDVEDEHENPTSVVTPFNEDAISIYPNPVKNIVNIGVLSNGTLQLVDVFGDDVMELSTGVNSVRLLPIGTYYVLLKNSKGVKAITQFYKTK